MVGSGAVRFGEFMNWTGQAGACQKLSEGGGGRMLAHSCRKGKESEGPTQDKGRPSSWIHRWASVGPARTRYLASCQPVKGSQELGARQRFQRRRPAATSRRPAIMTRPDGPAPSRAGRRTGGRTHACGAAPREPHAPAPPRLLRRPRSRISSLDLA